VVGLISPGFAIGDPRWEVMWNPLANGLWLDRCYMGFLVECTLSCGIMVPARGLPLQSEFWLALCLRLGGTWHGRFWLHILQDKYFISCLFKLLASSMILIWFHMKCMIKYMS
jgi:hypothetical protein